MNIFSFIACFGIHCDESTFYNSLVISVKTRQLQAYCYFNGYFIFRILYKCTQAETENDRSEIIKFVAVY